MVDQSGARTFFPTVSEGGYRRPPRKTAMDDQLFDTQKKRDTAVSQLRRLRESADWKVMADVLEANIKVLEARIIVGDGAREEIDRLRDRLRVYKDVRDTPDTLIRQLTDEDKEPPRADPYYTAEDLTSVTGGASVK